MSPSWLCQGLCQGRFALLRRRCCDKLPDLCGRRPARRAFGFHHRLEPAEELPLYVRRSKSLDVLVPILRLKSISTRNFEEALAALAGRDAGGLSATTISRLKTSGSTNMHVGKSAIFRPGTMSSFGRRRSKVPASVARSTGRWRATAFTCRQRGERGAMHLVIIGATDKTCCQSSLPI